MKVSKMNKRVKLLILVGLLVGGLWGASCGQEASPPGSLAPTPPPSGGIELVPQGNRVQSHEGGGVAVEAALMARLLSGAKDLVFDIVMDSLSVDLDAYDLASLASLRDNRGREFKPASWQAPKGGHHRQGKLFFGSYRALLQKDTQYIELVITGIAGVPERVLRWELRLAEL